MEPLENTTSKRRRNTHRLVTFETLDRRCVAYRETKRLIDEIEGDLGGADRLSTGERQLVQHGAVLGAVLTDMEARWMAGQPLDPTTYCTVVNAQRRVFESIGLRRRPRDVTPSVSTYLGNIEPVEAAE
jgi:hypothetical protein